MQQAQQYQQQQQQQQQQTMNGYATNGHGGGSAGGGGSSIDGGEQEQQDGSSGNGGNGNGNGSAGSSSQKFSRSKGACQQCRAVKQRCSGASRHPCERCQLYKLDCVFSKDPPPAKEQPRQPKKMTSKQASTDPETGAAVLHSLRVITERLRGIEETLANQRLASPGLSSTGSVGASGFDADVKIPYSSEGSVPQSAGGDVSDPVATVTSAIRGLDQIMAAASPFSSGGPSDADSPTHLAGNGAQFEPDVPDAVSRGFVSVEEAQQLFDFYFQRCVHWTPPLEMHNDRNMHHVRRRSTFLFHAILSVASYFCYVPQGENGLRKYYAIVTTLVESLAPIVVSPNPAELTVDLLMGLLICILWKPVRCGSQMQLGPAGFSKLQAQSKLNPSSGYVLGGLALRISQLLGLARRASNLVAGNRQSIQACRLWLWINLIDAQGALAEGKSPALDPSDALRATRLFASLKSRPADVRLAAMVELYAAVVPIVAQHHGAHKTDFRALYRANAVLDRITAYWTPLIEDAFRSGDPLAPTFLNVFVPFVRVVLNADVFRTWLIRRKAESKGGEIDLENARHTLTSEEAHCIGFAVSAAEEMLYYLSTASKKEVGQQVLAARTHQWAQRDAHTGHRPPLQLDLDVARVLSSSIDSVLLVVFAFPPLFLAQLRAQNIINCDLDMAPEITNDLFSVGFPSRALLPASKFMRLLEISAEFYEVTSPNNDFPAIPQAQLLRTMACLSVPAGVPTGLPTFGHGELSFLDGQGVQNGGGASCAWDGAVNTQATNKGAAHAYQMQQIAANVPPTNSELPYPYNTMVYSTEGADRLGQIMQNAVPDPLSGESLLGTFAKIDADWNAFFNPTAGSTPVSGLQNGNSADLYSTFANGGNTNNKLQGQSPDSLANLLATSPQNYYPQQQMQNNYGLQTGTQRQY